MAGEKVDPKSQPISDISEWGDRPQSSYVTPLVIGGQAIDIDKLPPLGEDDADRSGSVGGRAPLKRAG